MKTKEEIKKLILENCIDENGDIDLADLDFSDFEGDVDISRMKVKNTLYQHDQEVESDLYQNDQKIKGNLYQNYQNVEGYLRQDRQKVGCNLHQDHQKVEGNLYQNYQEVKGNLDQDCNCNPKKKEVNNEN